MKKKLDLIKNKLINIWSNNPIDIIVPIISIILMIIGIFTLGIFNGILLLILINLPYFITMFIINKQENEGSVIDMKKNNKKITKTKKKNMKKWLKILLLSMLICFIIGIVAIIGFFSYIVISAPEFNEELFFEMVMLVCTCPLPSWVIGYLACSLFFDMNNTVVRSFLHRTFPFL